ncbi:hypothetical protein [Ferrimonas lipolytica]|uniref:HupE / UreJ protein n=1 Tax=Ferrimonas lipolytica TaxID=2724191 RepID=A0A6H1UF50_9GAMM|nr:hypothetical protein [Ferrimonas lipolytica]QIZ76422.1 hypothetical protein HER31_05835 [Ferrimonas lipolytica]
MQRVILALSASLLPLTASAHEGHGAFGLFHHASDLMPIVAVAAVAWIGWRFIKR